MLATVIPATLVKATADASMDPVYNANLDRSSDTSPGTLTDMMLDVITKVYSEATTDIPCNYPKNALQSVLTTAVPAKPTSAPLDARVDSHKALLGASATKQPRNLVDLCTNRNFGGSRNIPTGLPVKAQTRVENSIATST